MSNRKRLRAICLVVLGLSASLFMASLSLWWSTGRESFTRWPNSKLEQADAKPSEDEADLLADIGFADGSASQAAPDIESRFAMGLVPGGFDPKHLLSVLTAGLAAGAVGATALVVRRRSRDA